MARRPDLAVVAVALAGLTLTFTAALSLTASVIALPAQPTIEALRAREAVDPLDLRAAVAANRRAANWFEPSRYLTDAALAASALPAGQIAGPRPGELALRAIEGQPASPHNWARLAIAWKAAGRPDAALRAWELSVLTGRYVPRLVLPRLDIGFGLLNVMQRDQIAMLGDQVRIAARTDPAGLERLAGGRYAESFVRAALSGAPELAEAYQAAAAARGG